MTAESFQASTPSIFSSGAGRNGLNPQFRFTMFSHDYNGEKIIKYNDRQYTIYRTYFRKVDEIELYTELKKGNEPDLTESDG